MFTDEEINQVMQRDLDFAQDSFKRLGELEFAAITGYSKDRNAYVCPMMCRDNHEKSLFYKGIRKLFQEKGVEAYTVISEVWGVISTSKEEVEKYAGHLEDCPTREEFVMLLYVDRDKSRTRMYRIIRNSDGTARVDDFPDSEKDEVINNEDTEARGKMLELLDYNIADEVVQWSKNNIVH